MIPNKVKVGCHEYEVIFKPKIIHESQEVDGFCDNSFLKIYISDELAESYQYEVFIHEVLHAVDEVYKLNLGEKRVTGLAPALISVFKDNTWNEANLE